VLPEIRRILYCTQLGPNAAYIFRYAYRIAEQFGARITVLHVVETLTPEQEARVERYVGPGTLHAVVEREERSAEARLKERIQAFCAKIGGGDPCEARIEKVSVVEGHDPAAAILQQARATNADLIVMGAHADSSILDALMGTTAQKVVRGSPVPVLTVQVPEGQQELTFSR
jgi:nucleotide-binding universal stress UspA family protein